MLRCCEKKSPSKNPTRYRSKRHEGIFVIITVAVTRRFRGWGGRGGEEGLISRRLRRAHGWRVSVPLDEQYKVAVRSRNDASYNCIKKADRTPSRATLHRIFKLQFHILAVGVSLRAGSILKKKVIKEHAAGRGGGKERGGRRSPARDKDGKKKERDEIAREEHRCRYDAQWGRPLSKRGR